MLLAIPFLPSLVKEAKSQSATRPKLFVAMTTGHGGVWFDHMFPADSVLTETANYAGRSIRRGNLAPAADGANSGLSQVLTAPSTLFTPALASKMNVIAGFDIPWYIAHHTGGHLGNFAANDGKDGEPSPTIDQVMANSTDFYGNLSGVLVKSLQFGNRGAPTSFYWSNPAAKSGNIEALMPSPDSLAAFNKVFVAPTTTPTPAPTRRPVVDSVYESYRRLATGDRRLSAADKRRLEEHMARLAEIQRRSGVVVDCSGIVRPTRSADDMWNGNGGPQGEANSIEAYKLFNDVVVAAFMCGTCRIATIGAHEQDYALFSDYVGDWHQLAHAASEAGNAAPVAAQEAETQLRQANQRFFQHAFLDLVSKLDVDDGTGQRLLDDALVVWTQESGHLTHDAFCVPVVTAGSAGGALRTGSYIDYRNHAISKNANVGQIYNPGLLWNQWLGVELQAMGVSRESYETAEYQPTRPGSAGTGGYGPFKYDAGGGGAIQVASDYAPAEAVLGEIPPFLRPA